MKHILLLFFFMFSNSYASSRRVIVKKIPANLYFHRADTIVRATAQIIQSTEETHGMREKEVTVQLIFTKVLKGDAKVGEEFTFSQNIRMNIRSAPAINTIDRNAKDVIVLFKKNWRHEKSPINRRYYHGENGSGYVFKLLEKSERERLEGLQKRALSGKEYEQEMLMIEISNMKESKNFDIPLNLVNKFPDVKLTRRDSSMRSKLLSFLKNSGDLRAVPILIKEMVSGNVEENSYLSTRWHAAQGLKLYFPGALGVDDAFQEVADSKDLGKMAKEYLARRQGTYKKKATTPWLKVQEQLAQNKVSAAKIQLLEIIQKPKQSPYSRYSAAEKLISISSPAELSSLRKLLLPHFIKDSRTENHMYSDYVARICTSLHHKEFVDVLIRLSTPVSSKYASFTFIPSVMKAVMELRSLGIEARKKGFKEFFKNFNPEDKLYSRTSSRELDLLKMLWLADKEDFEILKAKIPKSWGRTRQLLNPLHSILEVENAGQKLVDYLLNMESFSPEVRIWIVTYLGNIREPSAASVIADQVVKLRYNGGAIQKASIEAFVRIAGDQTNAVLEKYMTDNDLYFVRSIATTSLLKINKEKASFIARKVITEKDYGFKRDAFLYLQKNGTKEDFEFLVKYTNFWTSERLFFGEAMSALATLRSKYHYSLQ